MAIITVSTALQGQVVITATTNVQGLMTDVQAVNNSSVAVKLVLSKNDTKVARQLILQSGGQINVSLPPGLRMKYGVDEVGEITIIALPRGQTTENSPVPERNEV